MISIMCFGDSNTNGSNPDKPGTRHPYDVRWPGVLQKLLGEEYLVIEEGLGGRTTVWDDPLESDRCGLQFLPAALKTHKPLDLVILSLGTNDCKSMFHASAEVITRGMKRLVTTVKRFDYGAEGKVPKIMLIAPILIDEDIENSIYESFDMESVEKAKALGELYRKAAEEMGCLYFNASTVAGPGKDKLHMDGESHRALAEALAQLIRNTEL